MAGEKTTANTKRTTVSNAKATRGGNAKRKYENNDIKCSVDVGAKNRQLKSGEEPPKRATATGVKFQKGGAQKDAVKSTLSKSLSEAPKDRKARACSTWMEGVLDMRLRGVREEFVKKVRPYLPANPAHEHSTKNQELNRYEDVKCLDHSRVVIKNNPEEIDYIHASYVKINSNLTYICAQGPLSSTVAQFWLMVIQEEAKVVLQLCHFMEDDKEKCNEYYPTEGSDWKTYDFVQVRVLDKNTNLVGMKKVTKSKMQVKIEGRDTVYDIHHIFYFGWPDHSVAENVATCREVRNLVHRHYDKKPVVAHCSAGIGRTGTFVLVELACHRLLTEHDGDFKMFELARKLRDQRMSAIQNDQQYVFAFRCVVDILLAEDALPKTPEIAKWIEDYEKLISRKKAEKNKNKNKTT